MWGVQGRALSHPRLPVLWAGPRGPLPTGCGSGGVRAWDPSPTPQRALLRAGFARCGGGMRAPGGGASCLGVGRPGSGALPPPTARPLGWLPGPTTHWLWVRGGAGVGTRHQPHCARSCELALRTVGAARGRPGGAPPASVWGVRGRALSHPQLPALWAGCRGPLPTCCGCGGVRAWGPVTNPTARALACCGGGTRAPGGGASCLAVGRAGSGALPPPTARPLGGLPGPSTHWLWVRGGAGVGTRHQPHSTRSCELALRAEGAAQGRPGGAPPAWVLGVRGRALSHPRLPALWARHKRGGGGQQPPRSSQRPGTNHKRGESAPRAEERQANKTNSTQRQGPGHAGPETRESQRQRGRTTKKKKTSPGGRRKEKQGAKAQGGRGRKPKKERDKGGARKTEQQEEGKKEGGGGEGNQRTTKGATPARTGPSKAERQSSQRKR